MSDHIRPVKGMWLTNIQFLGGGGVTKGKAYRLTSGAGDYNPALTSNYGENESDEFSFADDDGNERYSSTDPTLIFDEWRLSTPEEIEDASL